MMREMFDYGDEHDKRMKKAKEDGKRLAILITSQKRAGKPGMKSMEGMEEMMGDMGEMPEMEGGCECPCMKKKRQMMAEGEEE